MLVLPPRVMSLYAERIERAYRRHRPRLLPEHASSSVWSAAATVLVALHRDDPSLPVDPEFYVACQLRGRGKTPPDPWTELVRPVAIRRYRQQTRRIVQSLRRELRLELKRIRQREQTGVSLDRALAELGGRVSPLACYIAAYRAGDVEAAESYRDGARRQHGACPLYRLACRPLLGASGYPVAADHPVLNPALGASRVSQGDYSMN